jgi:hypothetical protein
MFRHHTIVLAEQKPGEWFVPPLPVSAGRGLPPYDPQVLAIGLGVVEKLSRYGSLDWVLSWSSASS